MAGIALRVPGLYSSCPAHAWAVHPLRVALPGASRHPFAAMSPCPLSYPPLCHPSAN
ncbi:hypothetical protein B0G73_12242 [Paraburkholderia sp. BL25I1N1]|nr:hypothetical protein B0G73_12242 [Paraburkholderia sp. BL25I1N1]